MGQGVGHWKLNNRPVQMPQRQRRAKGTGSSDAIIVRRGGDGGPGSRSDGDANNFRVGGGSGNATTVECDGDGGASEGGEGKVTTVGGWK